MKRWIILLAGVAGGIAFTFACQHAKDASAAPSDCAVWQYASENQLRGAKQIVTIGVGGGYQGGEIAGWQPFAADATGHPVFRRCKP